MIKALVTDFAWVLLFPKDTTYTGKLNPLHKELSQQPNYNPLEHFVVNMQLLDFYASLKQKLPMYIFTSDVIQDAPEFQQYLQPVFNSILSASKMGTHKSESQAYQMVADEINLEPQEILYIDDNVEYVEAAVSVGMQAVQFVDNAQIMSEIQSLPDENNRISRES